MKFLFRKKSKKIEELENEIKSLNYSLYQKRKQDYNDFILILEEIQKTTNDTTQWKRKITTLNNMTRLATENYRDKIMELDINA